MSIKLLKPMLFALAASTLSIGSISTVSAYPTLCNPPVTNPTNCSDCHSGTPGITTYINGQCQVMNKPMTPTGTGGQMPLTSTTGTVAGSGTGSRIGRYGYTRLAPTTAIPTNTGGQQLPVIPPSGGQQLPVTPPGGGQQLPVIPVVNNNGGHGNNPDAGNDD